MSLTHYTINNSVLTIFLHILRYTKVIRVAQFFNYVGKMFVPEKRVNYGRSEFQDQMTVIF